MPVVDRLRIGLLGCGRVARRFHLPILAAMPGVDLVAVADPDEEARAAVRARAPRATLCTSHTQLLTATSLDAVVICLPPALHAEAAIASFAGRLHAYIEKPLATSLDDAREVIEAWRRSGTTGMVGFNYRFHPQVIALRDAVLRGDLGPVTAVRATFGAARRALPEWKRERSSGGGALLDLASHHVDLARMLLDAEVVEVSASVRSIHSEADTAVAMLRMSSGPLVSLSVTLAGVEEDRIEVCGPRGQLELDRYGASSLRYRPSMRDYGAFSRLRAAGATLTRLPAAIRQALWPPRERAFALALSAFVAAARAGEAVGPDLHDGLASLAVVLAAERSARDGVRIALEPEGRG